MDKASVSIKPFLEKDDIIIDSGNSFFVDTDRRIKNLEEDGIHFIGMGVSGGESGVRRGPSLMPGAMDERKHAEQSTYMADFCGPLQSHR